MFYWPAPGSVDGLTDFFYQRDRETIAFARPDLAVSGMGSA
jgi:esterase/lipase superfamily enzyme